MARPVGLMTVARHIEVKEADEGMRLDRWFRHHYPGLSHGLLEKMLRKGQIRIHGRRIKARYRVIAGDMVRIPPLPDAEQEFKKQQDHRRSPVRINAPHNTPKTALAAIEKIRIFEDAHLLVLNKPFGLAVQGGTQMRIHLDVMLATAFGSGDERPRLVHRLDKDTGGVLVLAKNRRVAARLSTLFKECRIEKEYWALCDGVPRPAQGRITLPIAKKMPRSAAGDYYELVSPAVDEVGKKALTDFQLVEEAGGRAGFLALRPITGRTHQLRVHCAAMGHCIIGDRKYGGPRAIMAGISPKMHLFCRSMRLAHPDTGRVTQFIAPLTGHMRETWRFFDFPESPDIRWPDKVDW